MEDFIVKLRIRAECEADAKEMINDYVGEETEVEILSVSMVTKAIKIKLKNTCDNCSRRKTCSMKTDCVWCSSHSKENNDTKLVKEKL